MTNMKKCDCLPAIKNVWCEDPHCEDDRIGVAVDFSGKIAKIKLFDIDKKISEPTKPIWKIKINKYAATIE